MISTSPLTSTHTANLPCDHCGGNHQGVSQRSLTDAFTHARVLLDNCKYQRAWIERQAARSRRNARKQD